MADGGRRKDGAVGIKGRLLTRKQDAGLLWDIAAGIDEMIDVQTIAIRLLHGEGLKFYKQTIQGKIRATVREIAGDVFFEWLHTLPTEAYGGTLLSALMETAETTGREYAAQLVPNKAEREVILTSKKGQKRAAEEDEEEENDAPSAKKPRKQGSTVHDPKPGAGDGMDETDDGMPRPAPEPAQKKLPVPKTERRNIEVDKKNNPDQKVSAGIIVSKNEVELLSVLGLFKPLPGEAKIRLYSPGDIEFYMGVIGDRYIAVLGQCGQGAAESVDGPGSRKVTQDILSHWPECLLLATVGIAFGTPKSINPKGKWNSKLRLGDVLIGQTILPYAHLKFLESGKYEIRGPGYQPLMAQKLLNGVKQVIRNYNHEYDAESAMPAPHLGPLLSGPSLFSNDTAHAAFAKLSQGPGWPGGIIGGEMEGFGLVEARKEIANKSHDQLPILIVKGVSDLGDSKKGDTEHEQATAEAVKVFELIMDELANPNLYGFYELPKAPVDA